jgi:hypothetical protein
VTAASVRARLAGLLAACGIPRGASDAALEGFEGAFAVARHWSEDAARARSAENAAIADYGRDDDSEPP